VSSSVFRSILFTSAESGADDSAAPPYFGDLNFDQIVNSVTAGRDGYDLKPFFHTPAAGPDEVHYRHEVFADLQDKALSGHIGAFAQRILLMRDHLAAARKLHYPLQQQRWFLEAVAAYCDAVTSLARDLGGATLTSRGFLGFREYVTGYASSESFTSLASETAKLREDLSRVTYCLQIKGNRVRVTKYEAEPDYSKEVLSTFEEFRQGAVKDYRARFVTHGDMNHVEAAVLGLVAKLYPEVFGAVEDYCARRRDYLDATVARFDREIQFYLAYLDYIRPLQAAGLRFCHPEISAQSKDVHAHETFDLALAAKLVPEHAPVVSNDFSLTGAERVLVITGPNQGGKTTLARAFGQLHYLARLGCPVPGRDARLFLSDQLFSHFEKEESLSDLSGKLQDDLVRIHDILSLATPSSVIIMNEIFTSTTAEDALFLGQQIMGKIIGLGALCVFVTFLDELASMDVACVSMVAAVAPDNPAVRTYKVVRRPADGLAYAVAIAAKHGLTYELLKERLAS
jgi:DNA mismatch repair protein MutS